MIEAFVRVIRELGYDEQISFHGRYNGYGCHTGVAITTHDSNILFRLGALMGQEEELETLCESYPVVNTLGRGVIISWPDRLFSEADLKRIDDGEFNEDENEDW